MQPLEKSLRKQLETTVKEARDIAENAARVALEQLGVGEDKPYSHLSEEERELRRKLRAHGRQLGDVRRDDGKQEINWLLEEVAYEHWHRMLFARFLAENNLLMYPDPAHPIAITLEECEELAAEEGARNGWELASRYAARMLPQIFRPDSPVFSLVLPPEHERKLETLLAGLPEEVFLASDSIGWVYQFWQAKRKDEVNASEVKIGARELPAVTQLFTEPYMVSFLLDNSLGAWWASRRLTEDDLKSAATEEELRQKASLPGVPLEYLRFVKKEDGMWTPAAGTFDSWPEHLSELKTLDPCCGSGHFLVAALLMIVPMRMELEGLSASEAVDGVLRENIHGLEIDKRCVELAAFALALTAWKYPGAGGYRTLPELNVACSGLAISAKKEEWLALAGENANLRIVLEGLYNQFNSAPVLGSLINPEISLGKGSLFGFNREDVAPLLTQALSGENDDERAEMGVAAFGLSKAAMLLAGKYQWVITNVPYLARGKQTDRLRDFCGHLYAAAKNDLATVFLDRCMELCVQGGTCSIVLPQNWLFLTSYRKFREKLLKNDTWYLIARLGPGAFETIGGEVVKAILITLSRGNGATNLIHGFDVSEYHTAEEKAAALLTSAVKSMEQEKQLDNPDSRVTFENHNSISYLTEYADSMQGIKTGDDLRYKKIFWEVSDFERWVFAHGSPNEIGKLGNVYCLDWIEKGTGFARFQGLSAFNKRGLSLTTVSRIISMDYYGFPFTSEIAIVIPKNIEHLIPIKSYVESKEYEDNVRGIDQNLAVSTAVIVKVPFNLEHWTKVAKAKYPNGLPKPYSDDPTQWIFHGHPCGSVIWDEDKKWTVHGPLRTDETVLQVAVARLLGYRWPAELDESMELAEEQREWVKRSEELLPYADDDGIVCIPPVRGETQASDQLLNLLVAAYGDAWSNDTLVTLLKNADHEGKTLETWLREKFFSKHCKLFQHRPFIWYIWDGVRDGFAALVNYHKLDKKLLETLIYTYLGDWIARQKQDMTNGVDGAVEKLDAAENLKKQLERILEGEGYPDKKQGYDIFVRWKPIEKQPIGWDPDLNDGVRLNIRPFMSVQDVGKKGAGILRDKPNIKWDKDRGKDVESAPWYHLFQGDRINDHHLSLEEKKKAREGTI